MFTISNLSNQLDSSTNENKDELRNWLNIISNKADTVLKKYDNNKDYAKGLEVLSKYENSLNSFRSVLKK